MSSSRARFVLFTTVTFFLVALAGCGQRVHVGESIPGREHLLALGGAYSKAAQSLGHAPQDLDEILPFMPTKSADKASVLRSPDDGEEYVVYWGTDPVAVGYTPLIAHEKQGRSGKRYVLLGRFVEHMSQDQFDKLLADRRK
jgi:hypothetical protein